MSIRNAHKAARYEDLPAEVHCDDCDKDKPLEEMVVFRDRRRNVFCVRSRCKGCNNRIERGHRREWKRNYLREWRKRNAVLNESYWKNNDRIREQARIRAAKRFKDNHDALCIQGRMRRHGMPVSIEEARELVEKFGRCYPSRFGLTVKGLKYCEQIRSRLRVRAEKLDRRMSMSSFQIRLMVYEESLDEPGLVIPPADQPVPYKSASRTMERVQGRFRAMRAAA